MELLDGFSFTKSKVDCNLLNLGYNFSKLITHVKDNINKKVKSIVIFLTCKCGDLEKGIISYLAR